MLTRLESDSNKGSLEGARSKQQVARLEGEKKKWQALLPSCVDETTGEVDREREEYYWTQIREIDRQLEEIKARPAPAGTKPVDYSEVICLRKYKITNRSCQDTSQSSTKKKMS